MPGAGFWAEDSGFWDTESGFWAGASNQRFGAYMGTNMFPNSTNLALSQYCGLKWVRWGAEVPWYLDDPTDHTSALDLSPLQSTIDDIHSRYTSHGDQMAVMLCFFGCPTSLNASASDVDGGWHYYPTDAGKRTAWADLCVEWAGLLDPDLDYLQIGNEVANLDFNKGDQSPTVVGQAIAECILAVRAAHPTLRIIGPSLNSYGDLDAGTATRSPSVWGAQMVDGDTRLVGTAIPDLWACHTYTFGGGQIDFNQSDPLEPNGWNGHRQADEFRQVLIARGVNSPQISITEMGEPSYDTDNPTTYSEEWQRIHAERDFIAMDYRRAIGWYAGPEIRHNMYDTSITIDGGKKFGIFRSDITAKPVLEAVLARSSRLTDPEAEPPPPPTGAWVYDSASLPLDFPGPFDDPLAFTEPPDNPALTVSSIELGTPPMVTDGYFNLDSSVLDGDDELAPDVVWRSLDDSMVSVQWGTGLTDELGRPDVGTMTVTCERKDRRLDPHNANGDWYPHLFKRPKMRLSIEGVYQFTGTVEDVSFRLSAGVAVTTFTVVDGWAQTSGERTWTPKTVDRSGARVDRLLTRGGFKGSRYILPGTVSLQAGTEQSGSVMDQIADVVDAEAGLAYFNADGVFVFLDRPFLESMSPSLTFDVDSDTGPSDAESGTGTATFYPLAEVRGSSDGPWFSAGDADAASRYGERKISRTVPLVYDADMQGLADYLYGRYSAFTPRFRTVTFDNAAGFPATAKHELLSAQVGTAVTVRQTNRLDIPNETITTRAVVIGVSGELARGYLRIAMRLREIASVQYFTLDDPTLGVLDGPYPLAP